MTSDGGDGRGRQPRRAAWLGVAGLVITGCGSDPNLPFDLRWESEHFDYRARADEADACPQILTALEDHFSTMQRALGFSWPSGAKVTYHKFRDGSDLRQNSECGASVACTNRSAVQTWIPFETHELIHAYLRPTGFPPWLLVEGAAVAASCQVSLYPRPAISWREAYSLDRLGPRKTELYGAGGWLSALLLRARPVAFFVDLYRRAGQEGTASDLASLFEEIYGESLDAVWAETTSLPRPLASCPWECSRQEEPADGVTPVAPSFVCGVGAVNVVRLDQESELVSTVKDGALLSLGTCGDGTHLRTTYSSASTDGTSFAIHVLAAGQYFVGRPGLGTLTLAKWPSGTWLTTDCNLPTTQVPWANLLGQLNVAVPAGTWHLPLSWADPRLVVTYPTQISSSTAMVCPACDSPTTDCTAATMDAPFAQTVEGDRFLRIDSAPPRPGAELAEFTVIGR